jgi:hypothetical protein
METMKVRQILAYPLVWLLYHVFKYNYAAFGQISPEFLEQLATIADNYDKAMAAHFRTLKGIDEC